MTVLEGQLIELPLAATGTADSAPAPARLRSVPAIEVIESETTEGPAAESRVTAKPVDPQEGRYTTRYRSVSSGNEWCKWRSGLDSNPRPPARQAGVITDLTTAPEN